MASGSETVRVGPAFKLSLVAAFSLTLLCLLIRVALAVWAEPSEDVADAARLTADGFKIGFGAIVGLIGGKTAS